MFFNSVLLMELMNVREQFMRMPCPYFQARRAYGWERPISRRIMVPGEYHDKALIKNILIYKYKTDIVRKHLRYCVSLEYWSVDRGWGILCNLTDITRRNLNKKLSHCHTTLDLVGVPPFITGLSYMYLRESEGPEIPFLDIYCRMSISLLLFIYSLLLSSLRG